MFQLNGKGDAQILSSHLGMTSGASHGQGDANSDGDVDVFQINGQGDAQILIANLGTDLPAGSTSAYYNRTSGELTIRVGVGIGVVGFELVQPLFVEASTDMGQLLAAQSDGQILAYVDPMGLPEGLFSLGHILPAGLDPGAIQFAYSPIGHGSINALINVVPEPHTIILTCMSLVGLVLRRRIG